jgi:hypothetical protein
VPNFTPAQNQASLRDKSYFEINGDAITEVLFKDEVLAIDGNDLVMKYWDGERPMRYEKQ